MSESGELRGKRVLLTGAAGGIGELLVGLLRGEGAVVIAHARSLAQLAPFPDDVERIAADLSSIEESKTLAAVDADVIIHNAGVGFGADKRKREESRDGLELRMAVNYLAPFAINELLSPKVKVVVAVSSVGQAPIAFDDPMSETRYDGFNAYRQSKLAMIMDTFERARRDRSRVYVALHPGTLLATKMVHESGLAPLGTADTGADAVLHATKGALDGSIPTGTYLDVKTVTTANDAGYDVAAQAKLRSLALAWTSAK